MLSGEQERKWKWILCSRDTKSDEKPFLSKKTACIRRHERDCHETDGACSWATNKEVTTKQCQTETRRGTAMGNPTLCSEDDSQIQHQETFVKQSHTNTFGTCGAAELLHAEVVEKERLRTGALPYRVHKNTTMPSKEAMYLVDSTLDKRPTQHLEVIPAARST